MAATQQVKDSLFRGLSRVWFPCQARTRRIDIAGAKLGADPRHGVAV